MFQNKVKPFLVICIVSFLSVALLVRTFSLQAKSSVRNKGLTISKLKEINPSPTVSSSPEWFVTFNGKTYFTADDGTHGRELWVTDGTEDNTLLVKDVFTTGGNFLGNLQVLVKTDDSLFFTNGGELWRSDGTPTGTEKIAEGATISMLGIADTLYFQGEPTQGSYQLWKSDGTADGTVLVKDIEPDYMTNVSGTLFFVADDGTHGRELWKSDGMMTGTVMVKDIYPDTEGSMPFLLTPVGDKLFFKAKDPTYGWELWVSDGTEDGTFMLKDIYVDGNGSPDYLRQIGNNLVFCAQDDQQGYGLWITDGTEANTKILAETGNTSCPLALAEINDSEFLVALDDGVHGRELWISDGTPTGTTLLMDITAGDASTNIWGGQRYGNIAFFGATDTEHGGELWWTDGTVDGTALFADIYTGPKSSSVSFGERFFYVNGNMIFFGAIDYLSDDYMEWNRELWMIAVPDSMYTLYLPMVQK